MEKYTMGFVGPALDLVEGMLREVFCADRRGDLELLSLMGHGNGVCALGAWV
jgi:hypothetical protein